VDVLQFIKLSGRNGVLTLDGSTASAQIGFFGGNVVRADHPASEPLGRLLVANGCLSEEELEHALGVQQRDQPSMPIGALLVRLGMVARDDVVRAFRQQMLATIHELLRWRSGVFRFTQDEQPPWTICSSAPARLSR